MKEWGYDPENGIDTHLIYLAKQANKEVMEIESLEFQFNLLGSFSDTIQAIQLKSTLEDIESAEDTMKKMFNAWETGDTKAMEEIMLNKPENLTDIEKESYREYEKLLFDDRNNSMTEKAEEYLKSNKTVFFVVGSGHMIGDTGIVNQLINKGYRVKQK